MMHRNILTDSHVEHPQLDIEHTVADNNATLAQSITANENDLFLRDESISRGYCA